ncbi:MAG: hypothetical protein ACRD1N_09185 [Terriglobia bacterium]
MSRTRFEIVVLVLLVFGGVVNLCAFPAHQPEINGGSGPAFHWQSPARLRHGLVRSAKGTLSFTESSISFEARDRRFSRRWPYVEIETVSVARKELTLTSYQNRGHFVPGDHRYSFLLSRAIPPDVAERLVALVGKPIINADPAAAGPSWLTLPARHRTLTGGTNGFLRFSDRGIDYITRQGNGGRSWRWADIQTIARSDPYHFRVAAFRETFDFELKRPMPQRVFDRLWDFVYGRERL